MVTRRRLAVLTAAAVVLGTVSAGAVLVVRHGGQSQARSLPGVAQPTGGPSPSATAAVPSPTPSPLPTAPATAGSPSGTATARPAPASAPAHPTEGGAPVAPVAPVPAGTAAVRVAGNHLVNTHGAPLVLHGVSVSGTEFACDQGGGPTGRGWSIAGGQPLGEAATYAAIAAWHIDSVRVPLNEDCWLNINGVNPAYAGANYQAAITAEVTQIHAAGMIAILDLHWTSPGPYAAVAQQPLPDADHSIALWQSVATTFRNDPAVIFDIFNEPFVYPDYIADHSVSPWACWRAGCMMSQFVSAGQTGPSGEKTQYTTAYRWRSAGMQELVDAVRQTGARQPVLINGLDWANDLSGWSANRPDDPAGQLLAGWHSYPHQGCSTQACWDTVIAFIAASVPVLIGETGDSVTGAVTYDNVLLPWADAHRVSYVGWTWNPWLNPDNVLIRNWSGAPTSNYGQYFHDHLQMVATTG